MLEGEGFAVMPKSVRNEKIWICAAAARDFANINSQRDAGNCGRSTNDSEGRKNPSIVRVPERSLLKPPLCFRKD
jgi:hypothetical protein